MNSSKILLMAAVSLATGGVMNASTKASKEKPNILFILADDLGFGDLSCQYAEDLHTPNIDRIFDNGLKFTNFYANSNVSSPTRAALMTGCFPAMVGVPGVIRTTPEQNWGYFDPSAVTLPQMLKKADYNTALIGKWHLGLETPNLPRERGFDFFQGYLGDMMEDYYTHIREGNNYMYLNEKQIDPKGHATDLFTKWSEKYFERQAEKDEPFFLYLAYNAPHSPLQPPVEWLEKVTERNPSLPEKRARLVALIEHLDYNIGKILASLEATGQLENTVIIFTSDNGGDRGSMANNGPTRGYKGDMYEGGLRVPFAIHMPGKFKKGKTCDNFAMTMDMFPTLCEIAGVEVEHEIDGISILPAIQGRKQDTESRYVFWLRNEGGPGFCGKSQSAVKYGDYKYLQNMPYEQGQMFNIEKDPMETTPLELRGKEYKGLHKALTEHYRKWGSVPYQAPRKK